MLLSLRCGLFTLSKIARGLITKAHEATRMLSVWAAVANPLEGVSQTHPEVVALNTNCLGIICRINFYKTEVSISVTNIRR